ncbi:MAG: alpha-L-fucosidase [Acutalibacteraceae bacterium]
MESINSAEFLNRITSVVPEKRQIDFQNLGYYNFIHFGLNTFTKKEWGSGKVSPEVFTLTDIDTDKWAKQLKDTGSSGVILTAKHHDGFCLFPSLFTDYTISATKYQNGKGDLVKQLADSCKKYGLKFGIYLSPWDRHESTYGTEAYNNFFCNQLTELCTNYGEIFCFWFDGACGEDKNGKKQRYDWERYFAIIRKLQPNAVITNCGPDVRWIGNEFGKPRKSEFSVVPKKLQDHLKIAEMSQQKEGATVMLKALSFTDKSLGEREQLIGEELCWYPAEMDIPVTYFGWFWRPLFEIFFTRSVGNLEKCYYNSVGANATLLVNVPPNDKGELPDKFIKRLVKTRKRIEKRFRHKAETISIEQNDNDIIVRIKPQTVRTIVLSEDITKSQRIEKFSISANGKTVYTGTAVGFKKICLLKRPIKNCTEIRLHIQESRQKPFVRKMEIF